MIKRILVTFILLFYFSYAQEIPHLHDGIAQISSYLSSPGFLSIKDSTNDLSQVDSIYAYAVRIYHSDHSEALLALTFALLPYKEMPLKIPILGISWNIPLPHSADTLYYPKNVNLPKKLFSDSPNGNYGDKDKLSHFFGNAFLSFNISLFNFSEFIGIFIELFEESFKIEGSLDQRDLITNELGKLFGEALQNNVKVMPSEFFKRYDEFIHLIEKRNDYEINFDN